MSKAFDETRLNPRCPHAKATFKWWDHSHRPKSMKWSITACRILFSNLVTNEDIKFKWLRGTPVKNTVLEVTVRYPYMINFPSEMSGLITDKHSNHIFHEDHACTQAFAAEINERQQEDDGYVYDSFHISFEEEQDPVFVPVGEANLTGFGLLRGKYLNADNEACQFKLLQLLVRNKDLEENRSGTANSADCGTLGNNTRASSGPFSSPNRSSACATPRSNPMPMPMPMHVPSSSARAAPRSNPMPMPKHVPSSVPSSDARYRMQEKEIAHLRSEKLAEKLEAEHICKEQAAREAKIWEESKANEARTRAEGEHRFLEERRIREEKEASEAHTRTESERMVRQERCNVLKPIPTCLNLNIKILVQSTTTTTTNNNNNNNSWITTART
jgi:hypothetical protein